VTFGELVRTYRTTAGLTQEELSLDSGVSYETISELERGVRARPQRDTLTRLIAAFTLVGKELDEFEASAGRPGHTDRGGEPPRRQRKRVRTGDVADTDRLSRTGADAVVRQHAVARLDARPPTPPLIGRDDIMTSLLQRLDDNKSPIITLTSRSGYGKSRVLQAMAQQIAATMTRMTIVTCNGRLQGGPYDPIADMLRRCMTIDHTNGVAIRDEIRARLAPLVPLPVIDRDPSDGPRPGILSQECAIIDLGEAITHYLIGHAGNGRIALLVDDIHLFSPDALTIFETMMVADTTRQICAVVAIGPNGRTYPDEFHVQVAGRMMIDMPLGPLPDMAAATLLASLLSGFGEIDKETRKRLVAGSRGRPLELIIAADVMRHSRLPTHRWEAVSKDYPVNLGYLFRDLSSHARTMLDTIAVAQGPISHDLLIDAIGGRQAESLQAMDAPISMGLVQEDDDNRYMIAHPSIENILWRNMNHVDLREHHRRLAYALERQADPSAIFHFAYHYRTSGRARSEGVSVVEKAGDTALIQTAYHAAAAYFLQAEKSAGPTIDPYDAVRLQKKRELAIGLKDRCDAYRTEWLRQHTVGPS